MRAPVAAAVLQRFGRVCERGGDLSYADRSACLVAVLMHLPYLRLNPLSCLAAAAGVAVRRVPLTPSPALCVQLAINDIVRGKVTWNTDSLGDFVVLRR